MWDKVIGCTLHIRSIRSLYSMNMAAISLPLLLLAVLPVSCAAPQASSTSFLFTDVAHLAFLHWSESVNGKVSGQEDILTFPASLSATSVPVANILRFFGTFTHGKLSFRAGAVLLTGQIKGDTLQLHSPNISVDGQIWFAASQQQYNSFAAAFTAYLQLNVALNDLARLIQHPPLDSNPASLQLTVQQVKEHISALETTLTAIRSAASMQDRCGQVSQFDQQYPVAPETFQLPAMPQNSALAHDLQVVRRLWQQAQRLPLPQVSGLVLPWRISRQRVNAVVQAGQQAYRSLQTIYRKDEQTMKEQEHTYQQIGQQAQPFRQGC